MTLISTTQVLFDPNRIVLDKNGNYIPPEYYKLFVGDDKQ
jgi:hypothetical protein